MERLTLLWLWLVLSISPDQTTTRTLTVTLHDLAGAPVVGITVLLRTAGGTEELARATTDATGTAAFAAVGATEVRIAFTGQAAGGTPLYQAGDDAQGMRMTLQDGPNRMAFVLDPADGMIAPDPLAVSALETGGPLVTAEAVFPIAPVTTPASFPTVTPALAYRSEGSAAVSSDTDTAASDASPPPSSFNSRIIGLGIAVLVVLSVVTIGLVVVQRRWR